MSPRYLLTVAPLSAVFLICSFPTRAYTADAAHSRPNILWIVSEDNNPWLGCYGDPAAHTPTLDRLAEEGIRYANAHSTAPVCAPCRASLITGRYAPGLGTQHMRSSVPLPEGLRYFPAYLRDAGYFCTNHAKTDYNAEVLPGTWDENGPKAHWRDRAPGQPFFAVFNLNSTHESSLHKRRPLKTDPASVRVPAYLPDTAEVRADIAQYHDNITIMDGQVAAILAELMKDGLADDTIVFYYGDNGGVLPRSKRFLYDNGTHVPLIICFPKKWEKLAPAEPGSVSDEMVVLHDLAATVLSLADIKVPETFEGRALAGPGRRPSPKHVFAFRDRMDEAYDLSRAVIGPRYRYIRNYHPEIPNGQHLEYLWRMASMREWDALHRAGKLNAVQSAFFEPKAPEQLFDVENDPDNVHNLATDPAYRGVLEAMRVANREHLLAIRDLGFLPEPMLRTLSRGLSPVVLGRDSDVYPLESVIDFLDSVQRADQTPVDAIRGGLKDANACLRYWAAVCAVRTPELREELKSALTDTDANVRLAAAFSMLLNEEDSSAWSVVNASLQSGRQNEERITAVDMVALIGHFPEAVRETLENAKAPDVPMFANFFKHQVEFALGRSSETPEAHAEP